VVRREAGERARPGEDDRDGRRIAVETPDRPATRTSPAPCILHPASRTHPSKGAPVVALVDVRHRVHALRQRRHLRVQHTLALQHHVRAAAGRGQRQQADAFIG
jgi:hypothetical protein